METVEWGGGGLSECVCVWAAGCVGGWVDKKYVLISQANFLNTQTIQQVETGDGVS